MTHIRTARSTDVAAIVEVFHQARAAALDFLAILHSAAEDRAFFGALVEQRAGRVAVDGNGVRGFMILGGTTVEHLYVAPDAWRRGIGTALLQQAKRERPAGLDLWVFQRNHAAIAFYEAHGFTVVEATDGSGNEEREPDVRMRWAGR